MSLIEVKNLRIYFQKQRGFFRVFEKRPQVVHAVDDISFNIRKGEIFGLVGETGCGKTTTGLGILRLVEPTSGEIFIKGKNLLKMNDKEIFVFRRKAQIIFQDPYSSLSPRMTIREIISEPLQVHGIERDEDKLEEKVTQMLKLIGLNSKDADKFPHEFSGGQMRRIGVARILILQPEFIIADEPTSGMDVSVAAAIVNFMQDLRDQFNLTYLWISHNLHMVRYISNRMAVMYLGKIVEMGGTTRLVSNPMHPYTRALFSAMPMISSKKLTSRIILKGEIPSVLNPPSGCRFRTRCRCEKPLCSKTEPMLMEIEESHFVSCHLYK